MPLIKILKILDFCRLKSRKTCGSSKDYQERFIITAAKKFSHKYNIALLFFSDTWVLKFEKSNSSKFISAYTFDLNPAAASQICQNKCDTSQLLSSLNIPHIIHHSFFSPSCSWSPPKKYQKDHLLRLFFSYNQQVVIKPADGTGGKDIFFIQTKKDLLRKYALLCRKYTSVALSPFYNFSYEYRIIVLSNQVQLCYKKVRNHIIGDGKTTIYTLVKNHCKTHNSNLLSTIGYLLKKNYALHTILPIGVTIDITWKHNLSTGAKIDFNIPKTLEIQLKKLALHTIKSLNMEFASVDIAHTSTGLKIIEVNNGVMMEELQRQSSPNIKKTIYSIYEKAFCKMLNIEKKP